MSSTKVLRGLIPWLLYVVLTIPNGDRAAELAAVVALGWAVATALRDLQNRRSVKLVDICAIAVFATFAIVGTVGDAVVRNDIDAQGRGFAVAALAAVMLVSAAVSPFTEQYARETVPAAYWSSPVFRSLHRDLSIRWGVAMVIVAISYLSAADLHAAEGSRVAEFALTWLLPAVVLTIAARTTSIVSTSAGRQRIRSGTP